MEYLPTIAAVIVFGGILYAMYEAITHKQPEHH